MRLAVLALALAACSFRAADVDGGGGTGGSDAAIDARTIDAAPDARVAPPIVLDGTASFVEQPWDSGNSADTLVLSPLTTKPGDVIAVFVTYEDSRHVTGASDEFGDTFVMVDDSDDGDDQQRGTTLYAANVHGGTATITVQLDGSSCCRVAIAHAVAGLQTTLPLDAHSHNHQSGAGTSPDAVTSNSDATTVDGDYVFAATSDGANTQHQEISAGSSFTREVDLPNDTTRGNATASEDAIQPNHGSTAGTFTYAKNNGDSVTLMMAFKPGQ